jgi:hypothetical protein
MNYRSYFLTAVSVCSASGRSLDAQSKQLQRRTDGAPANDTPRQHCLIASSRRFVIRHEKNTSKETEASTGRRRQWDSFTSPASNPNSGGFELRHDAHTASQHDQASFQTTVSDRPEAAGGSRVSRFWKADTHARRVALRHSS